MSTVAGPGVVAPATDFIVSPGSGLQVQVTSGCANVQQTVNIEGGSAYNGLYMVVNDATANPYNTISAPITNSRIDQIILRVYDTKEQGLGGSSFARLEWLVGSENASASLATMGPGLSNPGAASLPANSLLLAYVLQTVGESSISGSNVLNASAWGNLISLGAFWGATNARALKVGNFVFLEGILAYGNSAGAGVVATLPTSNMYPLTSKSLSGIYYQGTTYEGLVTISTGGVLSVSGGGIGATIYLDGKWFAIT